MAWTAMNPVSIGDPTKKDHYDNLWDNAAFIHAFLASCNLTDHGILVGSGTGAITPLGVATNGQLPIGSTGADPVLATLTMGNSGLLATCAAGAITLTNPWRKCLLTIANGTNASTLKCTLASEFNGDTIAETDNVAKGATTGSWTLDADGKVLDIELGDVLGAGGFIMSGNEAYISYINQAGSDIRIRIRGTTTNLDITALVDTNTPFLICLIYETNN